MDESPVLQIENLVCGYGGRGIIKVDSLKLFKGQAITVVGGNGSGKSTFLQTVCGLIP